MSAGLKQKTHKAFEMSVDGYRIVCVVHYDQKVNPYHLYLKWYDGGFHVKQVARYCNLVSVICHIKEWMVSNHIGYKDPFDT